MGVDKAGDTFLNFSFLAAFRCFCVSIFNKKNYLLPLIYATTL